MVMYDVTSNLELDLTNLILGIAKQAGGHDESRGSRPQII